MGAPNVAVEVREGFTLEVVDGVGVIGEEGVAVVDWVVMSVNVRVYVAPLFGEAVGVRDTRNVGDTVAVIAEVMEGEGVVVTVRVTFRGVGVLLRVTSKGVPLGRGELEAVGEPVGHCEVVGVMEGEAEAVAVGKRRGVRVDSKEAEGKGSTVVILVAEGEEVYRLGEGEGVLDDVCDLVPGNPGVVVGVTRLANPVGVPSREFIGEREGEGEALALDEAEELKSMEDADGRGVYEGLGEGCVAVGMEEGVLWFKDNGE